MKLSEHSIFISERAFSTIKEDQLDTNELFLYCWLYRMKLKYDNKYIAKVTIDYIHQFCGVTFANGDESRNKRVIKSMLITLKDKRYINSTRNQIDNKLKNNTPLEINFNSMNELYFKVNYSVFDSINSSKELLNYMIKIYDIVHLKKDRVKNPESGYEKWRNEVHKNDDHTCQICKESIRSNNNIILNAHHKDGYDWCIERRTDVTNGITLCGSCHCEFHVLYGYGGNTEQQYIEFCESKIKY